MVQYIALILHTVINFFTFSSSVLIFFSFGVAKFVPYAEGRKKNLSPTIYTSVCLKIRGGWSNNYVVGKKLGKLGYSILLSSCLHQLPLTNMVNVVTPPYLVHKVKKLKRKTQVTASWVLAWHSPNTQNNSRYNEQSLSYFRKALCWIHM